MISTLFIEATKIDEMNRDALKTRYQNLYRLGTGLKREVASQRGKDFEKLINDYFSEEGVLIRRSYHTEDNKREQIDAAIRCKSRVFLIEVKWVESGLAASALYAFLGKVNNKFKGTYGIFISHEELSDNFLVSLSKGWAQSVIVIHGDDIKHLFEQDFSFEDYIDYVIERLSIDNIVYVPLMDFIKSNSAEKDVKEMKTSEDVYKIVFANEDNSIIIIRESARGSNPQWDGAYKYIIEYYFPELYLSTNNIGLSANINLKCFIENYKPSNEVMIEIATKYYTEYLWNKDLQHYTEPRFIERFTPYYQNLTAEDKTRFEEILLKLWADNYGSYDAEDRLTRLIQPIWNQLSPQTKRELYKYYIGIYIDSSRSDRYIKKQFAKDILEQCNKEHLRKLVIEGINEQIATLDGSDEYKQIFIAKTFYPMANLLEMDRNEWVRFLKDSIKM